MARMGGKRSAAPVWKEIVFQELPAKTARKALSGMLEGGGVKEPQWAGSRENGAGRVGEAEERLRNGVNE